MPRPARSRTVLSVTALALALLTSSSGWALEYVIQPGDTLARVADRFYDDPSQWRRIAEANGLDNGKGFRPGLKIFIPEDGDPAHPSVHLLRHGGEVSWTDPAHTTPQPVDDAMPMLWQRSIATLDGAFAELKLLDGSRILLTSNTRLTMLGELGGTSGKPGTGRVRVRLEGGTLEFFGIDDGAHLEVAATGGIATLSGRHLVFTHDVTAHRVTALEGTIAWAGGMVDAGHGALLSGRTAPTSHALPRPVAILAPTQTPPALLGRVVGSAGPIARWRPDPRASAYDVALAMIGEPTPWWQAHLPASADTTPMPLDRSGPMELRVRAVIDGVVGPWERSPFVGLWLQPSGQPIGTREGEPVFMGSVSLQPSATSAPMVLRREGQTAPLEGALTFSSAEPRPITLTATVPPPDGATTPAWTARGQVSAQLAPIPGVRVSFSPDRLDPLAPPPEVTVQIELSDANGRPVTDEAPTVEAGRRSCTASPTSTPGLYRCTLRPRAAPGLTRLPLVVTGRGGSFRVEYGFSVEQPPAGVLGAPRR